MKLQLTVFAQNLKPISDEGCHPFAVVAEICAEPDTTPTVLGKTESLRNTLDPDFTKIFILRDFVLGKPMHVLVALHDAKHSNQKIGSAIFDVGSVLGTKGGVLGKELKSGGYLMVHVERTSGMGSLNLKLRGLEFTSKEEQVDPYFELQKKRQTTSGETVWDVVFRSMPVENTVNPIWSEISMDLGALCGGKRNASFRITVKDYDDSDDTLIGSCFVTVDKLLKNVTEGADTDAFDEVNDDKAIRLIRPGPTRETGKILVAAASITDAEDVDPTSLVEGEAALLRATPPAPEEEEDIVMELSNDVETVPDDLNGGANFVDYISGGCQLRVVVAIDYTASNGDPRKEDSLHHFKKSGMNTYEQTISKICTILSEYDSDQQYLVYGFGAKMDGELSHCFPLGKETEAEGVEGILAVYKQVFKTGIVMSKPTNFTEVIRTAAQDARTSWELARKSGCQEFTILTIFTNGNVHSVEETIAAFKAVKDDPLSTVVIGVGPGNFADMSFINQRQNEGDRVHFVDTKLYSDKLLAEETLRLIPEQLVSFFSSKGIQPNTPLEIDDIVIEPFNEEEEGHHADIVVSEAGDISVEGVVDPPPQSASQRIRLPASLAAVGGKGKSMVLSQARRQFGRITKRMERNVNRMIDQSVNKAFGIPNVTQSARKRYHATNKGGKKK